MKKIKKSSLIIFMLFLISIISFGMNKVGSQNNLVAQTEAGKIEGTRDNGIYSFKGIAYAKAERFKKPVKVDKWNGVKKATEYGSISPQGKGMVEREGWFIGPKLSQGEDLQNLNIWTPAIKDGKKRAVMVWLHGGGFASGSSAENYIYDGENLSRTGDIVVVSVNHRLNLMGYLDLSAYGEEYKDSANTGIMDLVAALEWIRDNIENFGGDPNNVTIFGESGGGAKVLTLMAQLLKIYFIKL